MLSQTKSRIVTVVTRKLSKSCIKFASHYDVLGITPKATQSEIKTAYYKLSKIYHPDKSPDEVSAKKFRAISEAYEVLGNIKLKKMYDKGMIVGVENKSRMGYQPEPEPTDPTLKFYKSHAHRHVTPTMDGHRPIYNFDEWSKNHYGDLLKKSKYQRDMVNLKKRSKEEMRTSTRQETYLYLMFVLGGLFIALVMRGETDYDLDLTKKNVKQDDDSQ